MISTALIILTVYLMVSIWVAGGAMIDENWFPGRFKYFDTYGKILFPSYALTLFVYRLLTKKRGV